MRAHLHTLMHMPHLHHDIAHTYFHTCTPIYIYLQIHTQLLPDTSTHAGTQVSVPPRPHNTTTHKPRTQAQRAPPYLAAWMSGPLAYVSLPQTFAPSHRAQVLI